MFRGSILLFTALLALCYRHQKLGFVDWLGVITTILGITIVGLSSVFRDHGHDNASSTANAPWWRQLIAMLLIIIAQGLQAFQTIVEEELLHDVDATESEIVSFEGLWGLYFSTFLTMPVANIVPQEWGEGLFEQSLETFKMLFRSWQLGLLVIGYCAAILGLNQTGMMITSFSTAIHRNIYEALRSIAVWALSAIVYYIWPKSGAGEKLDWWSFLQTFGFLVSIFGTFVYNRVVKFPCLYYPEDHKEQQESHEPNDAPLIVNPTK
jgi:hypothetical protein